VADREVETTAWAFLVAEGPPKVTHWIAARK
jgi:hypothetical protein